MKLPRRQFLRLAAGAAALPVLSRISGAQAYPSKPITVIVPFAAGGGQDVTTRVMVEPMRVYLGQPFIIENVTGAAGSIGVGRAARAAPDGYTLVAGQLGTHVLNGAIRALPYDLLNDFVPISLVATQPLLIVAKKAIPADDLKGLIAWLKANPGKAILGSTGVGSSGHVASLLFQKETGTRFQHVPYRGSAPALQDLVAGQIDLMFPTAADSLEQVRAGTIKAFAVMAKSRPSSAPDIPTVDEAGAAGLYVPFWMGIWAPKATPKDVVTKINAAVVATLSDPTVRRRLSELGQEIPPRDQQTPESLGAFQKAEIEKWWPIIKAANIKGE
jgi:tripartite-type tricarboxylate transporter receptor subunit TctC